MPVEGLSHAPTEVVVFEVGGHRLAIPGEHVRAMVRAVAWTALPGSPPGVDGVIDVRGEVVPLFDLRSRLALDAIPVRPSEQFLICGTNTLGTVALRADRIVELRRFADEVSAPGIESTDPFVQTLLRTPDGLIVLCDLDSILDANDIGKLARALEKLATA